MYEKFEPYKALFIHLSAIHIYSKYIFLPHVFKFKMSFPLENDDNNGWKLSVFGWVLFVPFYQIRILLNKDLVLIEYDTRL
jgi:hypothetical protein